jgi:hypothetical protein
MGGKPLATKRKGVSLINATPITGASPIIGQFHYYNTSTGTNYHALVSRNGRLDTRALDNTITNRSTALTAGDYYPDFSIANNLLFIVNSQDRLKFDGTSVTIFGITRPTVGSMAGAAGAAGLHNGTYDLRVTYYNSATGNESSASDTATATVTVANQAIDWTKDGWVDHGLGLSEIGVSGDLGLRKIRGSGAQVSDGPSLSKISGAIVQGANGLWCGGDLSLSKISSAGVQGANGMWCGGDHRLSRISGASVQGANGMWRGGDLSLSKISDSGVHGADDMWRGSDVGFRKVCGAGVQGAYGLGLTKACSARAESAVGGVNVGQGTRQIFCDSGKSGVSVGGCLAVDISASDVAGFNEGSWESCVRGCCGGDGDRAINCDFGHS